jgi:hypothetical protein
MHADITPGGQLSPHQSAPLRGFYLDTKGMPSHSRGKRIETSNDRPKKNFNADMSKNSSKNLLRTISTSPLRDLSSSAGKPKRGKVGPALNCADNSVPSSQSKSMITNGNTQRHLKNGNVSRLATSKENRPLNNAGGSLLTSVSSVGNLRRLLSNRATPGDSEKCGKNPMNSSANLSRTRIKYENIPGTCTSGHDKHTEISVREYTMPLTVAQCKTDESIIRYSDTSHVLGAGYDIEQFNIPSWNRAHVPEQGVAPSVHCAGVAGSNGNGGALDPEDEWRRRELQEFLGKMSAAETNSDSVLQLFRAQRAEMASRYQEEISVVEEVFNAMTVSIIALKQEILTQMNAKRIAMEEEFNAREGRVQRSLKELVTMKRDIQTNYEEIIKQVEKEPFLFILKRYRQQIVGFSQEVNSVGTFTYEEMVLNADKIENVLTTLKAATDNIVSVKRIGIRPRGKRQEIVDQTVYEVPEESRERQFGELPDNVCMTANEVLPAEHLNYVEGESTSKEKEVTLYAESPERSFDCTHKQHLIDDPYRTADKRTQKVIMGSKSDQALPTLTSIVPCDGNTSGVACMLPLESNTKQKYLNLLEKVQSNQIIHNNFYADLIKTTLAKSAMEVQPGSPPLNQQNSEEHGHEVDEQHEQQVYRVALGSDQPAM